MKYSATQWFKKSVLKRTRVKFVGFMGRYWLVVGSLLLLFNLVVNSSLYQRTQNIDKGRIENRINAALSDLDMLAAHWFASPDKKGFVGELWKQLDDDGFLAHDYEKGIYVTLFERDSLVFWNTNGVSTISDVLEKYEEGNKVDTVGNSIVLMHTRQVGQFKAVMCLVLKRNYAFENMYLHNRYNDYIFNTQNILILEQQEADALGIRNRDGQVLFYVQPQVNHQTNAIADFLGWLGVLLVIFGFLRNIGSLCTGRNAILNVLMAVSVVIIFRMALKILNFPAQEGQLFEPLLPVMKPFIYSLGGIMMNCFITIMFVAYMFRIRYKLNIQINNFLNEWQQYAVKAVYVAGYVIFTILSHYILCILIFESPIEFGLHNLFKLNWLSVISYVIVLSVVAIRIIMLYLGFEIFNDMLQNRLMIFINIILLIIIVPLDNWFYHTGFLLLLSQILITVILFLNKDKRSHKMYLFMLSVLAFYLTIMIFYANQRNRQDAQLNLLNQLSKNRDPYTENVLKDYFQDFDFRRPVGVLQEEIRTGLGDKLQRFDIRFVVDSSYYNKTGQINEEELLELKGRISRQGYRISTGRTPVYSIQDKSGILTYIVKNQYSPLYTVVSSARNLHNFVFTNITNPDDGVTGLTEYSFARYDRNYLIESAGIYPYELYLTEQPYFEGKYRVEYSNGYKHMMLVSSGGNTLIVSTPESALYNVCSLFVYIYLLLMIGEFLILSLAGYPYPFRFVRNTLSFKIRIILISVITISTVIVLWFVVSYYIRIESEKNRSDMIRQTETVLNSYINRHGMQSVSMQNAQEWTSLSRNIFGLDMVMYDSTGRTLNISEPAMIRNQIFGDRMPPVPYHRLKSKQEKVSVYNAAVGDLTFKAIYVPVVSSVSGQTVGYIGVPFLQNDSKANQNRYSLIITILNIFTFVTFIAIVLSIFLYNSISRPISALSQGIRNINQRKKIHYSQENKSDEIGALILQYNKMIDELEENYERISQIERETAWKQMAQQVAHEIKNPLTPMKLKIQAIKRQKDNGNDKWMENVDDLFVMLLEQIDLLSSIAKEFSDIGKIDAKPPQLVDVDEMLLKLQQFYSNSPSVKVVYENYTTARIFILIDHDSVWRAFVNICSNAIYAIGKRKDGLIRIRLERESNSVTISISDNGMGMMKADKQKIFQHKFTTKRSGSGLGLVITKQVIEHNKGSIRFISEYGIGTTFFVTFPIGRTELTQTLF